MVTYHDEQRQRRKRPRSVPVDTTSGTKWPRTADEERTIFKRSTIARNISIEKFSITEKHAEDETSLLYLTVKEFAVLEHEMYIVLEPDCPLLDATDFKALMESVPCQLRRQYKLPIKPSEITASLSRGEAIRLELTD